MHRDLCGPTPRSRQPQVKTATTMGGKRGGENRQLRPEEVAALEENDGAEAGTFAKANDAVLAKRRSVSDAERR